MARRDKDEEDDGVLFEVRQEAAPAENKKRATSGDDVKTGGEMSVEQVKPVSSLGGRRKGEDVMASK